MVHVTPYILKFGSVPMHGVCNINGLDRGKLGPTAYRLKLGGQFDSLVRTGSFLFSRYHRS